MKPNNVQPKTGRREKREGWDEEMGALSTHRHTRKVQNTVGLGSVEVTGAC